jgi:hypothetical protein
MKIKIEIEGKQEDLLNDAKAVEPILMNLITQNLECELTDEIRDIETKNIVTTLKITVTDAPILSFSQD